MLRYVFQYLKYRHASLWVASLYRMKDNNANIFIDFLTIRQLFSLYYLERFDCVLWCKRISYFRCFCLNSWGYHLTGAVRIYCVKSYTGKFNICCFPTNFYVPSHCIRTELGSIRQSYTFFFRTRVYEECLQFLSYHN